MNLRDEISYIKVNDNAYIYDVINLNDLNLPDLSNSIQTKICMMEIQKNNLFTISSVSLNQDSFNKYNLSQKEILYWLYYFQKNLLCSSIFSFFNLSLNM